jgi:biopolymer transport protein TolR
VAGSAFRDEDDDAPITDINVTPFVDVALVLLVIFMVTAKLIVARGVEIEKPKSAVGGTVPSTFRVSVDKNGTLYVNGDRVEDDQAAINKIQFFASQGTKENPAKAIIAGDRNAAYGGVMRAITLTKQAVPGMPIALENERP